MKKMPIPNVSSRNYFTLNHLFAAPSTHQRDFVRENMQSVRQKSKETHKAKQNEVSIARYIPRTISQSHIGHSSGNSSSRQANSSERSKNLQQRSREFHTAIDESDERPKSKSLPAQRRQPIIQAKVKPKLPHAQSVAVQTDEICDEVYLYTALKKCASPAFKSALKAKYLQKEGESKHKQQEAKENDERQHPPNEGPTLRTASYPTQTQIGSKTKSAEKADQPSVNATETTNTKNLRLGSPKSKSGAHFYHFETEHAKSALSGVNDNFNVMSLSPDMKKATQCQPNVCANCPEGYHLLDEREREKIKTKLLERETLLLKQLNSFPLAIETLRIRQSKTRIEHELSIIEQNLRKLTKRKVYAKITNE